MGKFFEDLKAALDETLKYKKGNIKLHEEMIEIEEVPKDD